MPIQRITYFKVIDDGHFATLFDAYQTLKRDNQKDGKPYILEINGYQPIPDARNQGYNFVSMSKFKDLEDMKFYDKECPAHGALKALNVGKVDPPVMTTYFEVP